MISFNILTFNNSAGIVTDALLLEKLLKHNISENVKYQFVGESNLDTADVGIWIQNYDPNLMYLYKKNIFFINEEWAGVNELSNLHLFDYVICKSNYAKTLLAPYCDVTYIPFISKNYYDSSIPRSYSNLHFVGRSIQKNTELLLSLKNELTLIDPYNRYQVDKNINHINTYQSTEQLVNLLNSHTTHICCSLYESWGHYLFEGLSTGAEIICSDIPVFREQLDPDLVHFICTSENTNNSYIYCNDNKNNLYPVRKSFFINEILLKDKINDFKPIGKNNDRINLFNKIIQNNKNKLINFFLNF